MANVYEQERNLEREITDRVGGSLPGVEVLAVDVDREPLRAGQLDSKHLDAGQGLGDALADLVLQGSLFFVDVCQLGLLTKNGRRAPISPTGEMWCSQDSKLRRANGPARGGANCPV